MKIWTELETTKNSGETKIGVHIESKKRDNDNIIDYVINGAMISMEIISILRALKDYDNTAFHIAMEHFIEEEIAEAEEDKDNE